MKAAIPMMHVVALAIAAMLAAGPVMADNDNKGNKGGKGGKHQQADRRDDNRGGHNDDRARRDQHGDSKGKQRHFEDRQQVLVRDYYAEQFRGKRCPPGLAKKNNGCMPPGQAKRWQVGRPLAREVVYYQVPQPLVMQIGPPPSGHRYVRVDSDILMIAIGTGLVIDAIQNLGRN